MMKTTDTLSLNTVIYSIDQQQNYTTEKGMIIWVNSNPIKG